MWKRSCAAMALVGLVVGCGSGEAPPPRTITVSPELPGQVLMAAAVARDAWCSADVHWCPELVDAGGEAEVVVESFEGAFTGGAPGFAALNDHAGMIRVAPHVLDGVTDLSGTLTHEFGHFGIDGHVPSSALMHAWFRSVEDMPHLVDTQAAMAWGRQQGS